jgi:hypothetical protein
MIAGTWNDTSSSGVIASRIRDGKVQVLLMTSRDTGRWIIPKRRSMRWSGLRFDGAKLRDFSSQR